MANRPILIMAGGTGGHVYPALAVADYLHGRGIPLFWLGTRKGIESRVVPGKGYTLLTIHVSGLRGKGLIKWVFAPLIILVAVVQAMGLLIRIRPAAVLGMGGFASGPGGLAAWLMRIPLCVHEQNAIAGMTNRLLAPLACRVMQAFPETFTEKYAPHTTGNPVRNGIHAIPGPAERYPEHDSRLLRVLILGGSQGARALNEVFPRAMANLPDGIDIDIWHQCGERLLDETTRLYEQTGCKVKLVAFIEDMAAAYSWADLVISRSGALTVSEVAAAGVASVLIPFPFAVDDHQTANARYLSDSGAALLLPEHELDAGVLTELLADLYRDRKRLIGMAVKARQLSWPDATHRVAETCLEVAYA